VQRVLAQLLLAVGRIDEAEKFALAARETVGPADQYSRSTTRVALAQIRAAQGMDDTAEALFREAFDFASQTDFRMADFEVLPPYIQFLRDRGRDEEADALAARLAEATPASAA
jgi:ATP/maltotriose-dependent transcriptional regulator MalT